MTLPIVRRIGRIFPSSRVRRLNGVLPAVGALRKAETQSGRQSIFSATMPITLTGEPWFERMHDEIPKLDLKTDRISNGRAVWCDTAAAAAYMCSKVKTLEHWRQVGGGPPYAMAGRKPLYRFDWLDQWLEARSVVSTAEARRAALLGSQD